MNRRTGVVTAVALAFMIATAGCTSSGIPSANPESPERPTAPPSPAIITPSPTPFPGPTASPRATPAPTPAEVLQRDPGWALDRIDQRHLPLDKRYLSVLAEAMSALARELHDHDDPDAVLAAIVTAAVALVPCVEHGSISVVLGRRRVESEASTVCPALASKRGRDRCSWARRRGAQRLCGLRMQRGAALGVTFADRNPQRRMPVGIGIEAVDGQTADLVTTCTAHTGTISAAR